MTEKGYYYLKLKENFFDSEEMKVLESMENGYLYSNILLKLYLKALKNNGKLTFNDYIPYNLKMLSTIVGHNVDIVDKAIKVFQSMHLIEILDNGIIYMLDMQKMIGSISSEGVRKAEYRERIKAEQTLLGQCPNIIYNSVSNSISNSSNNIEERV
jgi:predicted phage replisome organizer